MYKFVGCKENHDCLWTFCSSGSFWYRSSLGFGINHKCLGFYNACNVPLISGASPVKSKCDIICPRCKAIPSDFAYLCLKLKINNGLKFERDAERMSTAVVETLIKPYKGTSIMSEKDIERHRRKYERVLGQ